MKRDESMPSEQVIKDVFKVLKTIQENEGVIYMSSPEKFENVLKVLSRRILAEKSWGFSNWNIQGIRIMFAEETIEAIYDENFKLKDEITALNMFIDLLKKLKRR